MPSPPPPPPPNFRQLRFLGQQHKSKLIIFKEIDVFYFNLKSAKFDEFMSPEWLLGDHMLTNIFTHVLLLVTVLHCTSWCGVFSVVRKVSAAYGRYHQQWI